MKFFSGIFFIAAIFIAGNNAGSPVTGELVCDIVAQISYEFTSFTNNIIRLYILNLPRSEEITAENKSTKLDGLVDVIHKSADVPEEDKERIEKLCRSNDGFEEKALADQLTRANIWDCFVEIFTNGMSSFLTD